MLAKLSLNLFGGKFSHLM